MSIQTSPSSDNFFDHPFLRDSPIITIVGGINSSTGSVRAVHSKHPPMNTPTGTPTRPLGHSPGSFTSRKLSPFTGYGGRNFTHRPSAPNLDAGNGTKQTDNATVAATEGGVEVGSLRGAFLPSPRPESNPLTDSGDFTFLPPLEPQNPLCVHPETSHQSSTVTTTSTTPTTTAPTISTTPTTIVPTTSTISTTTSPTAVSVAVPVPSQRLNFVKMEDQQQHRRSNGTEEERSLVLERKVSRLEKKSSSKILPPVNELKLPEMQFAVTASPTKQSKSPIKQIVESEKSDNNGANLDTINKTGFVSEHASLTVKAPLKTTNLESKSVTDEEEEEEERKEKKGVEAEVEKEVVEKEDKEKQPLTRPINLPITVIETSSDSESMQSLPIDLSLKSLPNMNNNNNNNDAKKNTACVNAFKSVNFELPPELHAETLMDPEHKAVLAKLRFVLQLVDSLVGLAQNKSSPLSVMLQSRKMPGVDMGVQLSEAYRRVEQLVIYVRALHMLSSALQMAQKEVAENRLFPSTAVKDVLNALNDQYQKCLLRSQELASLGLPSKDPSVSLISAERLMYNHALELCQSAALDELFGNAHLCSQRYQTAYIMLHCLSQQVINEDDRVILYKYKDAVEKRLRILEKQGHVSVVQ